MKVEFLNEISVIHTLGGKSYNAIRNAMPKADVYRSDFKEVLFNGEFRKNAVTPIKYVVGKDWAVFGCIGKLMDNGKELAAPFMYGFSVVHRTAQKEFMLMQFYTPYSRPKRQLPFSKKNIALMERNLNTVLRKISMTDDYHELRNILISIDGMDWRR